MSHLYFHWVSFPSDRQGFDGLRGLFLNCGSMVAAGLLECNSSSGLRDRLLILRKFGCEAKGGDTVPKTINLLQHCTHKKIDGFTAHLKFLRKLSRYNFLMDVQGIMSYGYFSSSKNFCIISSPQQSRKNLS